MLRPSVLHCELLMAGALGIEPRPSVLETDVLTVEHHAPVRVPLKMVSLKRNRCPERRDTARPPRHRIAAAFFPITSFPCAGYACDNTDSTCDAPNDPD